MRLSVDEVVRITGGRRMGPARKDDIDRVIADSREIKPGDLFAAIKGGTIDGHDYVAEAFARGAIAAMVEHPVATAGSLVMVDEVLGGLRDLAAWVREIVDPLVVAVTGSIGKTTTKDFLASIAERKFSLVASQRSYNTEVGVPLTLLRATRRTELVISEMGSRGPGQIAALCEYVLPHVGIVTNVHPVHLEVFGSVASIAEAKSELVASLPEGGTAVLNGDDPVVAAMAHRTRAQVLTFGTEPSAAVTAEQIRVDAEGRATLRISFEGEGIWVTLPVPGRHQVPNALGAVAAAIALGFSLADCRAPLESARLSPWHMEVRRARGVTFVNDAWNASPVSTAAAIETCAGMVGEGGRLIVVLGHMAELGPIERQEHLRIGALVASLADRLIAVGERARAIAEGAETGGLADVQVVAGEEEAVAHLGDLLPSDVVLVKGSRVARLEGLVERVMAR